jgi:DNA helicase-2/ATP-dependent DNA helicase PcrA
MDFRSELNEAQYAAVMRTDGPVLVIAGAGSGKTRTIVYRLAHLVRSGVAPDQILLLTFTRKAAQEMMRRAEDILGHSLAGASSGTFHSFAYKVLRMNAQAMGHAGGFTLMDRADSENVVKEAKDLLELGKGDRSYPKKTTITDMITKSRNKELALEAVVEQEAFHLSSYTEDILAISGRYRELKREQALLDYDDLLFSLEELLSGHPEVLEGLRARYRYIMVDEYQDTNRVQARLVKLLAGEGGNVMAVGDDAQSVYAFRGANVENILDFPKIFPGTEVIRLERNYRSTQPILDLTNVILEGAARKFDKKLYTEKNDGPLPRLVRPLSDQSQANLVVNAILDLEKKHPLHEIAVLFRSGFHSFALEVALGRVGIEYQKFGGIRFHEAAHVKDALAYLHLMVNPLNKLAFLRVVEPIPGIGPKTAERLFRARATGDQKALAKAVQKHAELGRLLQDMDTLRATCSTPATAVEQAIAIYTPLLMRKYPDDYPKRQAGLEQLAQIAATFKSIDDFLNELTLDGDEEEDRAREDKLVLSTVHSAKGLEWNAVIIIDLVEDRFPSRRAMQKPEDFEEERRLLYVACTRARRELALFAPSTIYNRHNGSTEPTVVSPFVRELPASLVEIWQESYSGGLARKDPASGAFRAPAPPRAGQPGAREAEAEGEAPAAPRKDPSQLGHCRHKIFGQGKIIAEVGPGKYRVNFPGFGLKVIVADYLELL